MTVQVVVSMASAAGGALPSQSSTFGRDGSGSAVGLSLKVAPNIALLASFGLSLIFVASMHFWKLVGYRDLNRDAVGTIQRRFASALVSCICSAALICVLADSSTPAEGGMSLAELLGFDVSTAFVPSLHCLALTAALFFGPVIQHVAAATRGSVQLVSSPFGGWVAARNYALAPFTEEFVFRACLLRLWVAASLPIGAIVFVSPVFFALAHAHHFLEHVRRCGDKGVALMQVGFQVFYTSLFGIYANFLLLRTGSIIAVILAHSFCNHQGFPDLRFFVAEGHPLYGRRGALAIAYCAGIAAFSGLLWPLTAGFERGFAAGRL